MAKTRKKDSAPEDPVAPQVGDKVKPGRSVLTYEISNVHYGGKEVDLHVPGTNMRSASVNALTTSPSLNGSHRPRPRTRSQTQSLF
jgi:hypothetical protein